MLTDDLKQLLADTPGVLVAGEAATDLIEDIQAVVIRALLASPNRAALIQYDDESLRHAVEDAYHSPLGIALFNLYTLADFPDKRHVLPSARKAVVEAMLRAMLLEQERHVEVKPLGQSPIDIGRFLIANALESVNTIRQRRNESEAVDDFTSLGC